MLVLYELKKQLERPFAYIVLALCFIASIQISHNDYRNRMIILEEEIVSEAGTCFMTEDIALSFEDVTKRSTALFYAGGTIPAESAEQIITNCTAYNSYRPGGDFVREVVRISSGAFSERLQDMNQNGELHAVNGGEYLFTALSYILWLCTAESAFFALLITSRIIGHEADSGTAEVIYSTRTGRRIRTSKAAAAVILSAAFQAVNCLLCGVMFFAQCPCFKLFASPLVVPEMPVKMFPWFSVSVGGFFGLNFLLSLLLIITFSLMCLCCSGKSGGIIQLLISLMLAMALIIPAFIKPEICSAFIYCLTPTALLASRPGYWLTVSRATVAVPGIELYAMLFWAAVFIIGSVASYIKFRKARL